MASNHTTNYNLNQWEGTDKVLRTDFNEDNAKIDAALKGLSNKVAGKAAQSAVNSLTQTVNGKADQSALNSLTQTVNSKADQSDMTAETAAREAADAALEEQVSDLIPKAGLQLLKTVTVNSTCTSFQIPLDDLDWSEWKAVHVLAEIAGTATSSGAVKINGNELTTIYSDSHAAAADRERFGHLVFYPMYDDRSWLRAVCWEELRLRTMARRYQDIETMEIAFDSPVEVLAGTKVTLWGEK